MKQRILCNLAIIISALFLPWWITAPLMVVACFFIPRFYEVVCYGILIDAVYGTSWGIYGFKYVWTAGTALLLLTMTIVRPWLSWEG